MFLYQKRNKGKQYQRIWLLTFSLLILSLHLQIPSYANPIEEESSGYPLSIEYGLYPDWMRDENYPLDQPMNRKDFAKVVMIFYDALGGEVIATKHNPFSDTQETDIIRAYHAGIINGKSSTLFAPSDLITRAEICVMLHRALSALAINAYQPRNEFIKSYTDSQQIPPWAVDAMANMNAYEIMSGTSALTLSPKNYVLARHAMLMLHRAYFQFKDVTPATDFTYKSQTSDVLTIDPTLKGQALLDAAVHRGFSGLVADYNTTNYHWFDNFGGLDYTYSNDQLELSLKGDNFLEYYYGDSNYLKTNYFRESTGMLYTVTDALDWETETYEKTGSKFSTAILANLGLPTYHPLKMDDVHPLIACHATYYQGEPALFVLREMRVDGNFSWKRSWISLTYGLELMSESYNAQGGITSIRQLNDAVHRSVDSNIFIAPSEVSYYDSTNFMATFLVPELSILMDAFPKTFVDSPFTFDLLTESGDIALTLFINGKKATDVGWTYTATNALGEPVTLIEYYDSDRFYTIIPSLETVVSYESSVNDDKWFQLDRLAFRKLTEDEQFFHFTFEDDGPLGVADFRSFYVYTVDKKTGRFLQVSHYYQEYDSEIPMQQYLSTYLLSTVREINYNPFEASERYRQVSYPFHDDGEHPPLWWMPEE